jgi:hypothetical protein
MINTEMYSIMFPARIVEFFPETCTANVLICAERCIQDADETNKVIGRKPIEEVPVHMPQGGGWSLTTPVKAGDTCMICFSQVGYDHWFYKDKDTAGLLAAVPKPHLRRKFSEDDGFCFVGFNPLTRVIKEYSANNLELRNEDRTQVISLDESGDINIKTDKVINVECDEANIVAETKVTVTAPEVEVIAETKVVMSTPLVEMSGDLKVSGNVDCGKTVTGTTDCIGGGKSLKGHNHIGSPTAPVGPISPTGIPV